jgi:cardiolipin synthase
MAWFHNLLVQATFLASVLLVVVTIPWILMTKKESTSAVAWCLLVFFVPFFGFLFFVLFGYQHVYRPLRRKRRHKKAFVLSRPDIPGHAMPGPAGRALADDSWHGMSRLAQRFGGCPATTRNAVALYHDGARAFDAILQAVAQAEHHVHLEYFIIQPDRIGCELVHLLADKARRGVEVRVLYDAMGSRRLNRRTLRPLVQAGGRCTAFLPLNPLRRRIQINMRDHRKILVIDGRTAFTGGLNIGDEYLGRVPRFGYWRDTHLRVQGPAVHGLQRVFIEDWDFAADELLDGLPYFPPPSAAGPHAVQVIASGPDQELNSIREVYFAAIARARRRLWISTPYFVPDAGLRDALCMAGYQGLDVRLLYQHNPDKWVPFFAGRFYLADVLAAGVRVYQYTHGMIHAKVVIADDEWASVGTANLDNRSMHLNFEVNCLLYSSDLVSQLEGAFREDLRHSIRLERAVFERRPLPGRLVENACRLLSPVL